MSSTRNCKLCKQPYHLIVPYGKARHDLRDFCPSCIRDMQNVEPKEQPEQT